MTLIRAMTLSRGIPHYESDFILINIPLLYPLANYAFLIQTSISDEPRLAKAKYGMNLMRTGS